MQESNSKSRTTRITDRIKIATYSIMPPKKKKRKVDKKVQGLKKQLAKVKLKLKQNKLKQKQNLKTRQSQVNKQEQIVNINFAKGSRRRKRAVNKENKLEDKFRGSFSRSASSLQNAVLLQDISRQNTINMLRHNSMQTEQLLRNRINELTLINDRVRTEPPIAQEQERALRERLDRVIAERENPEPLVPQRGAPLRPAREAPVRPPPGAPKRPTTPPPGSRTIRPPKPEDPRKARPKQDRITRLEQQADVLRREEEEIDLRITNAIKELEEARTEATRKAKGKGEAKPETKSDPKALQKLGEDIAKDIQEQVESRIKDINADLAKVKARRTKIKPVVGQSTEAELKKRSALQQSVAKGVIKPKKAEQPQTFKLLVKPTPTTSDALIKELAAIHRLQSEVESGKHDEFLLNNTLQKALRGKDFEDVILDEFKNPTFTRPGDMAKLIRDGVLRFESENPGDPLHIVWLDKGKEIDEDDEEFGAKVGESIELAQAILEESITGRGRDFVRRDIKTKLQDFKKQVAAIGGKARAPPERAQQARPGTSGR